MGKRTHKRYRPQADQTKQKLFLKRLETARMPQEAIQRFANGTQTPDDLLALQETLGNEAVAELLAQNRKAAGRESTAVPTVQRQGPMEEEEEMVAGGGPDKKEKGGSIWSGLKKAWTWLKKKMTVIEGREGNQTTTPETGSKPEYTPQEGVEQSSEYGEPEEEVEP